MPETLTQAQIDHYGETGYLILEKRIPDDVMSSVRGEIARLCLPARGMTASDDRLDLEDSHTSRKSARPAHQAAAQAVQALRPADALGLDPRAGARPDRA